MLFMYIFSTTAELPKSGKNRAQDGTVCHVKYCSVSLHIQMTNQYSDILQMAYKQPMMQDQMQVLLQKEKQIPGSVTYSINRYAKHAQWNIEDTGMIVYHTEKNNPAENYIELKFCVSGNVYCREKKRNVIFASSTLLKVV